jgi:cytochrome c biogenesis protein CcdA
MSIALSAAGTTMSTMTRLLLLGAAVALGFVGGLLWSVEISGWAYDGFVSLFASPSIQITSQAMGVGMAFLLGFVHITTICYLPAALAALPLVQTVRNNREWLKTVAVLGLCMVVVTAIFGVIVSAPASLLAGIIGSRRTMSQIMQPTLIAVGILLIIFAMGELGLMRRLLPSAHFSPVPGDARADMSPRTRYRRAAWMGFWMAATFGVVCPKPLYVALLVYVAVVGSAAYGALTLGAYGLGLAASVAVSGLILLPASRAARFNTWLAARDEGFHLVQGIVFAAVGALAVAFFWLKYTIPPA